MLKMIICDDDKIFCSSFEDLVIELCRERNLKYEIFMFYETAKLKKFLEDNNDIDLIFLDIELKKTPGYELGNYIRNVLNLQKIDIVYISNNSSYAMALFKTRPIDFLIKPIKKEDLRNVIDQYLKLNKEKKDFFKFKNKIGYQKIDVQDIYYFESENKTAENTLVLSENDDVHIHGEERISTENADGTQTYLSGNNQSVMAEISSKGTMSQIEYDDFGKTDDKTSGYGYNGEKLDTTGNIYLRARYYNPRIGQFVQIDDYKGTQDNITSQNRYTYCLNNQYKYVDPSGNDFVLGIAIIGSIMILGSYVLGSLATPALRKANKNLTNVVSNALEKGKKATNNLKNTIAKKINSKKVIQTVTKAIAPAIPVGIKVLKSTLTIPQPCPTSVGFDQLPKELLPTIHGLAGASAFVNEYLSKLYRVKKREKKEKHHIVAKKAWDECGRVKHDFYLNKPRTAISHNLGSLDVEPNYAYISNTLHRYIHTRLYYGSIYINFQGLVEENEKNKRTILIRLGMYRKILEGLSDFANKIK